MDPRHLILNMLYCTHVAEKYVRQVNFYRGSTIFVSAAALEPVLLRCAEYSPDGRTFRRHEYSLVT